MHLFIGRPDIKFENSKYNCILDFFCFQSLSVYCFIEFQQHAHAHLFWKEYDLENST